MVAKKIMLGLLCGAFLGFISGCSKDDDPIDKPADGEKALSDYTTPERVNKFVVDCTHTMYLWEAETDWTRYQTYETYSNSTYQGSLASHEALFSKFIYKEDPWSDLTDDIEGLKGEFDGVSTTYGYRLALFKFTNLDAVFAVVQYVVSGSPAELKGLKRGDMIVGMNGDYIRTNNYLDLYYSSDITLTLGEVTKEGIGPSGEYVSMTAVQMYENPILDYRVIVKGAHKIGYLCYTGYQQRSEEELVQVFKDFKAEHVTDVVLDLRYNGGGYASTAQLLASILAPAEAVKNKDVYLTRKWNNLWMTIFDEGTVTDRFVDVPVNMDLEKLYVLTTNATASASEATIIGLKPYMDVVLIGESTSGKYCGGLVMAPSDYYARNMFPQAGVTNDYLLNISNWGMYIMVYRYANKDNYPSFATGIPPAIKAEELYDALKPIGAVDDPLLSVAIEQITGESAIEKRSADEMRFPSDVLPARIQLARPTDGKMIITPDLLRPAAGNQGW